MSDPRSLGGSTTQAGTLAVIAKTPVAGRVKTRLSPALNAEEACAVAWACLLDTLEAAALVPSRRHVLLLDGEAGPWVPDAFEVIAQRGRGLGDRLAEAFVDIADDAVVIAMDTPQVDPSMLAGALATLAAESDSVIGQATDGGYWIIGLRQTVDPGKVFSGIPMSTRSTGRHQVERLRALGLSVAELPELRDLDTIEDLAFIASEASHLRVAALAHAGGYATRG